MSGRDTVELLVLAALWGASFLFMRLGAADFGPVALVFVRVALASVLLLPLMLARGEGAALRQHWRAVALVGLLNTALPFLLFTMAALVLTVSLMSVINATVPIWGALVAWLWLRERLGASRVLGLAVGVAGVAWLSWGKADFRPGEYGVSPALAIAASVLATVLYGLAANISRRHLQGVPALAVAAGSQLAAAAFLLVPAVWRWPAVNPSPSAWWAALGLAMGCTALAYVLYFRLIAHVGATKAVTVTFLIPAFAMAWGWMFLAELPSGHMLVGCGVILLGTALSTGLLRLPGPRARAA
jgi:drug/metabolite transporter (DMT)-like permease